MTRSTLTSTIRSEAAKTCLYIAELTELNFPAGVVRTTNAQRNVDYLGNTFYADGKLLEAPEVTESMERNTPSTVFRLSGLDPTLISRIMTDSYQFARAQAYLAFFDEAWNLLDAYPYGEELIMSMGSISLDTKSGIIELSVESWDTFGGQDSINFASPENQKQRYSGDTFFDNVASIMTQEVEWIAGQAMVLGANGDPREGPDSGKWSDGRPK